MKDSPRGESYMFDTRLLVATFPAQSLLPLFLGLVLQGIVLLNVCGVSGSGYVRKVHMPQARSTEA